MEPALPNKTIYVSDDDLPLFERAQVLSGANLSSAIVQALRRFIEIEEAKERGFDEITIMVNEGGVPRQKRFLGYRLVRWLQPTPDKTGTEILNVYRTAGNRFALHKRSVPDWPLEGGDPDFAGNPKNWGLGSGLLLRLASIGHDWETFRESGTFSLQVYETLDDLKAHVSAELYRLVIQAMEGPESELLDI